MLRAPKDALLALGAQSPNGGGGRVVSFLHHPIFSAQSVKSSQVKSSQVKSSLVVYVGFLLELCLVCVPAPPDSE